MKLPVFCVALLLLASGATAQETAGHPEEAVCTVCAARSTHGSEPEPEEVAGVSTHEGRHYYFCSDECKREFDADPDWWVPMELPFPLPHIEVRDLEGEAVTLPVGGGTPTVLDFWATWCQPCKKTMRELQRRYEAGSGELRIVGVSIDEGDGALARVRKFVQRRGIHYPIYLDDGDTPAWVTLKVHAVPTMMLVDGGGRVIWRYTGPDGDARLEEALADLAPATSP
ncbi:MAG: redoxin domain-containing protein [Thermoanaerobaculia bacterium]|nr:redoxin domain-containing protein [Thermoanaerobaculia bacterium]